MIRIIKARGKMLRAFFDFSKRAGYSPEERRYIRRYFYLRERQCVYFLAMNDEDICARIMTWSDERYNRARNRHCGFFALFDGAKPALPLLLQAAIKQQRQWGSDELLGPIAPDGSGWFMGQCDSSATTSFFTGLADAGQTEALREAGFTADKTFLAYSLNVPTMNRFSGGSMRIASRFGLETCRLSNSAFSGKMEKAVYDVADREKRLLARQAEKIKPYIDRSHSFAVRNAMAQYTGYALSLKGDTPRIATVFTSDSIYRRPTVALLLNVLIQSYQSSNTEKVDLSVIDSTNNASNRLAENLGALLNRRHIVYYKKIT